MPEILTPPAKVESAIDPFADLHQKVTKEPVIEQKPTPEAPKETPKADVAPKPVDKPKVVVQPKEEPRALREKLEAAHRERDEWSNKHKTLEQQHRELSAKIQDYESRNKDTTLLAEKLTDLEKRYNETQAALRAAKHEVSPEFKEKYDKPMEDAVAYAGAEISQLRLLDSEGNPTDQKAQMDKHFAALYQLDYSEAKQRAKQLFGDDATIVMDHYRRIHGLERERGIALKRESEEYQKREQEETVKQTREREAIAANWAKVNQELAEKVPDYHDDPKDEESVKLRNEGLQLFDAKPASWEQKLLKDSHIRHMVGAFAPLKLRLNRLEAENAELKTKLAERQKSEPGDTKLGGGKKTEDQPKKGFFEDMKELQ